MYDNHHEIVSAYADMFVSKISEGYSPYLLSLIFNHIPGSDVLRLQTMERHTEQLYGRMLTRTYRAPHADKNKGHLPIWIVAPDLPVPKSEKHELRNVQRNDGLHLHALVAHPPASRMKGGLDYHVFENQDHYAGTHRPIRDLHCEPITHHEGYVASYALKSIDRRRFSPSEIFCLPRTRSEL